MYISDNGVKFIADFETLQLHAYKGQGEKYWTIGYGHYGADVTPDMVITEQQALDYLHSDLSGACESTNKVAIVKFPNLNQNQYDALVSYCFNRGEGRSDNSNGLRQLIYNSNTIEEIHDNFLIYWGTNEAVKEGLLNRRRAEAQLFSTPCDNAQESENQQIIERAITWAVKIANDDAHGYDQSNREGPDYDCSSLIIHAFREGGLETNATYTGDMKDCFKNVGFSVLDFTDFDSLVRGDVLLRSAHTEMYIGNGQNVGAHINENGTTTGGQTGDQTGKEICISDTSKSGPWTYVLRLQTSGTITPIEPPVEDKTTVYELLKETAYNMKQLNQSESDFLKTVHIGDNVKMKFTFNHNKRQIGTNSYGKRLTFDTKTYTIYDINKKGLLILTINDSLSTHKKINPKYIKGVNE